MTKILIVDHEVAVAEWIGVVLTHAGYSVLKARSRSAAMEVFRRERPSIVLAEVCLEKERDGVYLAWEIDHEAPETRIIMMCEEYAPGIQAEAAKAKVTVFLTKPFSSTHLLLAVKEMLTAQPAFK